MSFQSNSEAIDEEVVRHIPWSELQLPVRDIQKHHSRNISTAGDQASMTLEAENFVQTGAVHLHKLKLLRSGDTEWEQVLSSKIIEIAGSR